MERKPDLPENSAALRKRLIPIVTLRWTIAFVLLGLILFLPAGTFDYWQAWVFLVMLAVPSFFVVLHYLRKDPELIERRMNMREQEREQRSLIAWSYPLFLLAFILPGLDHRFGWSTVPLAFVIAADAIILCGYLLFVLVLKENRYASRVVEVAHDQIPPHPGDMVRSRALTARDRDVLPAAAFPLSGSPVACGMAKVDTIPLS